MGGGIGRNERAVIEKALATVGLEGFEDRAIGTLSGGQMQRALFARLLLQDARLILLDEPFASLDAGTVTDLLEIIRRWHAEQRTIVAVLHDYELVRERFPEALLLARSPVAWGPTADVLRPENVLRARRMCEAFDTHAAICDEHAA
jgi:zinc/manganese transport system ATP-binding protein